MFVGIMLVLIFLVLVVIANGLRTFNDNLIHFGRQNNQDNTDLVLLARSTKSAVWRLADRGMGK